MNNFILVSTALFRRKSAAEIRKENVLVFAVCCLLFAVAVVVVVVEFLKRQ